MDNPKNKNQLKIRIKDEDLKGNYSNLMQVSHTQEEFVLDFFLQTSPTQGVLASRIILSPGHLKRLAKALEENIKKYEEKFGKIEEVEKPDSEVGFMPEDD